VFRPLVSYNMVWRSKVPRSQTGKLDGYIKGIGRK